jgi:tetratricopeptide (TPR) repeat protein
MGASCPRHPSEVLLGGGDPTDAPPAPPVPGYSPVELLGRGGFASVFLARRDRDGALVALKVASVRGDRRFAREAQVMRQVGPPTTAALYDDGETPEGYPFLVMERLEGQPLSAWLEQQPDAAPPLSEALPMFRDLCAAVDRMHAAGVVHRDLKPENVFLREGGGLALLDLGLGRWAAEPESGSAQIEPSITKTGEKLGTPFYMSPEQCLGKTAISQSDLYSLGVLLFELLTGRLPFVGDYATVVQDHVGRRPPRPSQLVPLSPRLDEVLARALAKQPEDRFQSAGALLASLEEALAQAEPARDVTVPIPLEPEVVPAPANVSGKAVVALLGVRASGPLGHITQLVAQKGGQAVRMLGDRILFAFPDEPSLAQGVRAAVRCAQRVQDSVTIALVHAAELWVRRDARRLVLMGEAVDRSETWWPPPTAEGLLVTAAAGRVLGSGRVAPSSHDGFLELAGQGSETREVTTAQTTPLRGRDGQLEDLEQDARACAAVRAPGLMTVLGEVGYGKSRLLGATAGQARHAGFAVHELRVGPPESQETDTLLRELAVVSLGLCGTPSPEQVHAACLELLGDELGETSFPAVAFVLGALSEEAVALSPLWAASGTLRPTVAGAIARALRKRAQRQPLALLIDDAQWADQVSLDALELAALSPDAAGAAGEPRAALWICVTAHPTLLKRRHAWGSRTSRSRVETLAALEPAAARALLLDLLQPVEFVPEAVVARLLEITEGVPLYLVEVTHALRAAGAIRQHPGSQGGWFLAADELLHASATPLGERLAARALESLPASLLELAQLCAVMGNDFAVADVDGAQRMLEAMAARPQEQAQADPGVGLARLAQNGLLRGRSPGRYAFRHALLRDAIEELTPPSVRRQLHDASRRWLGQSPSLSETDRRRLARHLAKAGLREEAARAYLELAEDERRQHLYVEADEHYGAALEHLSEPDALAREQALAGRGKVRYRVERLTDAVADLRAARELAEARQDPAVVVDLLLEEAVALDWSHDFPASADRVEQAIPISERLGDPRFEARCLMGLGRSQIRAERFVEAAATLAAAARRAAELHDYETQVISLLLLGPALAFTRRLDEAEARFAEVIALCQRAQDRFHLAVAYGNRMLLWIEHGNHARAIEDLEHASRLARELGNSNLERVSIGNLALLYYFRGDAASAIAPARQARQLALRFVETVEPYDHLVLARILTMAGEREEAGALHDWIVAKCSNVSPVAKTQLTMIELVLEATPVDTAGQERLAQRWRQLVTGAPRKSMTGDEMLELLYFFAAAAVAGGRAAEVAEALAAAERVTGGDPSWRRRIAALAGADQTTPPRAS